MSKVEAAEASMDTGVTLPTVLVCTNHRAGQASCGARGSEALAELLRRRLTEENLSAVVEPIICLGHCARGPNLRFLGGPFFHHADERTIENIVAALKARAAESPPHAAAALKAKSRRPATVRA